METNESKSEAAFQEKEQVVLAENKKTVIPYKFHESILFVIWGWIMFLDYFRFYLSKKIMITFDVRKILEYSSKVLVVAGIIYTGYYLYHRLEKLRTNPGKSLLAVWISMFLCMVMVNLIQMNVMHKIVFELQHSVFMLITAIAIVLTGNLVHNRQVIWGGVVFAVLAFASSFLKLEDQLLLEAIGWMVAFVIPGHRLYSRHKKNRMG